LLNDDRERGKKFFDSNIKLSKAIVDEIQSTEQAIINFEIFKGLKNNKFAIQLYNVEWANIGLSKNKYRRVIEDQYRFAYMRAFFNATAVMLLRYCLPPDYCAKHNIPDVHKNDINDLLIATQAVFSNFLITEDKGLNYICRRLYKLGVFKFMTFSAQEFIDILDEEDSIKDADSLRAYQSTLGGSFDSP
jgi:hypothetical protein